MFASNIKDDTILTDVEATYNENITPLSIYSSINVKIDENFKVDPGENIAQQDFDIPEIGSSYSDFSLNYEIPARYIKDAVSVKLCLKWWDMTYTEMYNTYSTADGVYSGFFPTTAYDSNNDSNYVSWTISDDNGHSVSIGKTLNYDLKTNSNIV
jgi:hypothetical protein